MRESLGSRLVKVVVLFFVWVLALTVFVQTANAALTIENVQTWHWTDNQEINSVARGDVDGDGKTEIVTGGYYNDGTRDVAQLVVWDGATLAPENVQIGYWISDTVIQSVAVGDVDGDGKTEIVTGGVYNDGTRDVAMLCVWNGASLALENVQTWYWIDVTLILSIAIGNVDEDDGMEIVTGGAYVDGVRFVAQLCVWDGATLALENVQTWLWGVSTYIGSVAVEDVDGDGQAEIVTGGSYIDGTRLIAQLCVWNGASLALENVQTWLWGVSTAIFSVAVGDVDDDGQAEIVTGGTYNDGTRSVAQLCVWDGATLALENVQTWYWSSSYTAIFSVAVGNVDGDGAPEIVTGGRYEVGTIYYAQLCVWDGPTLALYDVETWRWAGSAGIWSVAAGDVDGDGKSEIVTGGYYNDGTYTNAQLCVWA